MIDLVRSSAIFILFLAGFSLIIILTQFNRGKD